MKALNHGSGQKVSKKVGHLKLSAQPQDVLEAIGLQDRSVQGRFSLPLFQHRCCRLCFPSVSDPTRARSTQKPSISTRYE